MTIRVVDMIKLIKANDIPQAIFSIGFGTSMSLKCWERLTERNLWGWCLAHMLRWGLNFRLSWCVSCNLDQNKWSPWDYRQFTH